MKPVFFEDDDIAVLRNGHAYVVCSARLVDPVTEDWLGSELYNGPKCFDPDGIPISDYDIVVLKHYSYKTSKYEIVYKE